MRALFASWGATRRGRRRRRSACSPRCGEAGHYPDLVVADLHLGHGASGIAAVVRLREEFGVAIPALIVSGDTGAAALRRVREAGLALLPKPVLAPSLAAAASALVAPASLSCRA